MYKRQVLELNDLVKACEEEFGVSAAAGVVVAAAGGEAAGAAEEKDCLLYTSDRLYHGKLWNDGRTGEETDYLNQVIGKAKLSEYTANIAFAGFTAPKILWMKKHEPDRCV